MIEAKDLTKRYGSKTAVDHASFTVQPGIVTGFLGPNGAGKSTTMRMILGLDRPTGGTVTLGGKPYAKLDSPLAEIGALIDAKGVHPRRSARQHLRALAATHGISDKRVDEVIQMTGLTEVAKKKAGQFSLGMGQRLGIAGALLADPQIVMMDEPVNGLDPDGVLWVRQLARHLASTGRTVFLSSHLMSEVQQTADHVIIIGRGRILADAPLDEFVKAHASGGVSVTSPDAATLAGLLTSAGATVEPGKEREILTVTGLDALGVGRIVRDNGILISQLRDDTTTLEQAYMRLTAEETEYKAGVPGTAETASAPTEEVSK
ncbi:ABC transporter ATP-binding protein [Demequina sp. NBRC 110056]|uniref:ABC transporter ATP-binding protein n=1 Tax=Demequina sp. NBRC 110056 TaxID=1570345 RepID=UPI000A064170|nr:ABC transporter ATP-binding protein [Demequina sp. NBRC 110056]